MRRLRGATGALVLSTALLVGGAGGAVAAADTGDSSTRAGQDRAGASDTSGASSRESARTTVRDLVRSATSAVESHRDRVLGPVRGADRAKTRDADVDRDAVTATDDGGESAPVIDDVVVDDVVTDGVADEAGSESGQSVDDSVTTATDPAVPASDDVAEVATGSQSSAPEQTGGTEPAGTTESSSPEPVGSGSVSPYGSADEQEPAVVSEPRPLVRVFTTMTTVVVSLGSAAAAVPPVVLSLPFSETPISDVIALLETVMASVSESATAARQLPYDLAALLRVEVTGTNPVGIAGHSESRLEILPEGIAPVVDTAAASPLSLPMTSELLFGDLPGQSRSGALTSAAFSAFAASPHSVPSPLAARMGEHQSLIDRAFGALLVPLSLWALATGALPGLAGLIIVFGAGIRVGYRNAKAGFAMRVSGIARFAGSGPLGVVRSGSFIALHNRAAADTQGALRWSRFGDQAA
ncbi:Uncharacterised protein [Mycolicibacterium vanbaalenii]|uniref:RDD domain-containing protein n=1 Tax=Mycolicibacterium vanbaalenii TaxID=110539 RepID=A0A5S9PNT9_MYCVN|nr:hypothetical protein [Mycolicibacterium vanbaalenii]CAA0106096.1 Uncharacterised protein [Mycolicibacterium vanbaalenii]